METPPLHVVTSLWVSEVTIPSWPNPQTEGLPSGDRVPSTPSPLGLTASASP